MITSIFIALTFSLATIYLTFYLFLDRGWKVLLKQSTQKREAPLSISLVIPYRNEIESIEALLLSIEDQNYPRSLFEVILVNDHSEDITSQFIDDYLQRSTLDMRNINLPEGSFGKKKALELGIEVGQGSHIVVTDVDTLRDANWLTSLVSGFESSTGLLIAPVVLQNTGTFLSQFQNFEFQALQYIGLAYAGNQSAVLCNGANMMYEKKLFQKLNGYTGNQKYLSGDDLFLLQKFKNERPDAVACTVDESALVMAQDTPTWKALLKQRIRWASKLKGMQDKPLLLLGYLSLTSWAFVLLAPIFEILLLHSFYISPVFIVLKMILDFTMVDRFNQKFAISTSRSQFVLSFVLYPLYYFSILCLSFIWKVDWRGRKIEQHIL